MLVQSGPASIASGATPARSSSRRFAAFRSTCHLPATPRGDGITTPAPRARRPAPPRTRATTSAPTSKQHGADRRPQRDAQIVRAARRIRRPARARPRAARPRPCRASRRARPRRRRCADRRSAPGCSRRRTRPARRRRRRVTSASASTRAIAAGSSPGAHAHDRRAVDLARDVERPRDAGRAQQAAPVLGDVRRQRRPSARPGSACRTAPR